MILLRLLVVGVMCTVCTIAQARTAEDISVGDIVELSLSQLHPTQASIGYDQVWYKLGRYSVDRKKLFDDICEANGQRGVMGSVKSASLLNSDSYNCEARVGTDKDEMKTVVIAPNGKYYLTDGHHTLNAFYEMPKGGAHFRIHLLVAKDYRSLPNMTQFWHAMKEDGNVWLYNQSAQTIKVSELPSSLGLKNFANDQYRALMYFSRGVAWNKPPSPVPFLEFYWANEIRDKVALKEFDLNDKAGYERAIRAVSQVILTLKTHNVGGSKRSTTQMGQFRQFSQKGLDKLLKSNGKVDNMLRYKHQLKMKQ